MLHRTPLPAAFSLLLTIYSLLIVSSLPSCKNSIVPPERLPTGPDTTSHEFIWQIDTIGAEGILYDVAIVNDTLIYAVGEIYLRDAAGQIDPQAYCVAVWNGASWALKRVHSFSNQLIPSVRGVLAFTPTDIWLADGGVHQWDGFSSRANQSFGRIELIGGSENGQSVDKLWGTGPTDLYGVGRVGMITHFNGSSWQKIESGTATDFADIWGRSDGGPVLAVASSTQETRIFSLSNQSIVESFLWPVALISIWISPSSVIYLSGAGKVWKQESSGYRPMEGLPDTIFYAELRGNADNDMFVNAGGRTLAHFNGKSWYLYSGIPPDIRLSSLAVSTNAVVAVGFTLKGGFIVDKAAVVIGR